MHHHHQRHQIDPNFDHFDHSSHYFDHFGSGLVVTHQKVVFLDGRGVFLVCRSIGDRIGLAVCVVSVGYVVGVVVGVRLVLVVVRLDFDHPSYSSLVGIVECC